MESKNHCSTGVAGKTGGNKQVCLCVVCLCVMKCPSVREILEEGLS